MTIFHGYRDEAENGEAPGTLSRGIDIAASFVFGIAIAAAGLVVVAMVWRML